MKKRGRKVGSTLENRFCVTKYIRQAIIDKQSNDDILAYFYDYYSSRGEEDFALIKKRTMSMINNEKTKMRKEGIEF